jgi:hypothetical protein
MFEQCNAGRRARFAEELPLLRALPARRLEACKRDKVRVDTSSTIRVEGNVYSVNSRLIGEWVEARLYAERVEVWYAQKQVEQLPRLRGRGKHRIAYRHVIDWLVRKPGAFADYRYRADLFPSSRFRLAYDVLLIQQPERAAKEYLSILQLAARESESGVEAALSRLLNEESVHLTLTAVIAELRKNDGRSLLDVTVAPVDLASYDALLESKEAEDGDESESECEREGTAADVLEGTAPASVSCELRGAGSASAAGIIELRAVPAGPGGTRVSGTAEPPCATSAAPVAVAAGEELADARPEASADQGGAASAELAGGIVRGSA